MKNKTIFIYFSSQGRVSSKDMHQSKQILAIHIFFFFDPYEFLESIMIVYQSREQWNLQLMKFFFY